MILPVMLYYNVYPKVIDNLSEKKFENPKLSSKNNKWSTKYCKNAKSEQN